MSAKKDVVNWKDRMLAEAKDVQRVEAPALSAASLRGGNLTVNGVQMPDNKMIGIILASTWERTFYDRAFDPDDASPPDCYARGETEGSLIPASNVEKPIHPKCVECPNAQWGSAPVGKGQACKTRRVLAVMNPDNPDSVVTLKTPPTSNKYWANYAQALTAKTGLPPHGVLTEISVAPVKTWYEVKFDMVANVPEDMYAQVFAKREEMLELLLADMESGGDTPVAKESTKY